MKISDAATLVDKMVDITEHFHGRQKYGKFPYEKHLSDVCYHITDLFDVDYCSVEELLMQCAARGHDLIEDTGVTEKFLLEEGFPEEVVRAIVLCTKKDGLSYEDYIAAICEDKLAWQVKVADTYSNLTCSIQDGKTKKVIKYSEQLKLLYAGKNF